MYIPRKIFDRQSINKNYFLVLGSMSLTTVTLALDDKLRSLRNSSFDSDKDIDIDVVGINGNHNNNNLNNIVSAQPLSIGENIPFADESPERPLIQPRSKPVRVSTYNIPATRYPTRLYSHGGSTSPNSPQENLSSSPQSHSSQENVVVVVKNNNTVNSSANNNNNNNNNNNLNSNNKGGSVSSDDTDVSTTSNPMEKYPTATVRIDRDMIREMNRILTTLERKATKLNRSFSLNYKSHKADCCCLAANNMMNGGVSGSVTIAGSNNNNTNYRATQPPASSSIRLSSGTITLTKDEKTDKNTNKKRQIQDGKSRRYTNRSIKRRHTVGGTHDYDVAKSGQRGHCQQGHDTTQTTDAGNVIRTSSPELAKDSSITEDAAATINCTAACEISVK